MPKPEIDDTKEYLRISYKCLDNHPGIESQFVPEAGSVTVTFRPEKLGLSEEQLELLLKLAFEHYDPDLRVISFEIADFPFKEQNEKKALTIVKNLMDYVKVQTKKCQSS